jgi:hypothetical protein
MTVKLGAGSRSPAVERNHWFDYKYIGARDLLAEQEYLVSRHRLHNRLLHGCGVICGLTVVRHPRTQCAADWVVVEPGIAIDALGRELIVAEQTPCQLPVAVGHGGSFVVCLRYREEPVKPVPILYADPEAGLPYSMPNRIREGVEIVVVSAGDFDADGWDVGGPGCIEPAPVAARGLVALGVADVDPDGEPVTITNLARRIGLPPHRPARIVELSWEHGGAVPIRKLRDERRLRVIFDRPLASAEGRARGIGPDTFRLAFERGDDAPRPVRCAGPPVLEDGRRAVVLEIAEDAFRREHEAYVGGSLLRVTLLCDFILDTDGVPVSGRHLGGHLPTADGSAGGTFESWFQVTDTAARRGTRPGQRSENTQQEQET